MKTSKFVNIIGTQSGTSGIFRCIFRHYVRGPEPFGASQPAGDGCGIIGGIVFVLRVIYSSGNLPARKALWHAWHKRICPDCNVAVPQCGTKGIGNDHKYIFEGIHELHPGHCDACE